MIENEQQLRKATIEAGQLIQDITDYVKDHPESRQAARVRFPRGFLRTASEARKSIDFIDDQVLKSNLSYALMTHDVLRWITFHTDISGQAREMIIKEAICLVASITESISIFKGERGLGRRAGFSARIQRFHEIGVINDRARDDLLWLWQKRSHEHIMEVPFREWSHYTTEDWYRSIRTYRVFKESLAKWRKTVSV